METYRGHVRNPADAIKLFEACRLGLLPRVQRRLSEKERQSIQSGSVFVWDEREAGMRRWTDGKSWSASRVSGSFLTYREMEGKRGGGNFVPAPRRIGGKTPESGRASDEDADMDGEGPDGYRYKADGLMKQSFSITTSQGQHLHLISYYARPHSNMAELPQPTTDPALRHIVPVKGMYPESTVHESAPPMRNAPMQQHPYSTAPQHMSGPPPPGRMPYPYPPQGYSPWPPSPMATPPYGYPPGAYASQLPPPINGHPAQYQAHPQHMPPHFQHHMSPQAYDRPIPPSLNHGPGPYDPQNRFPGQLPQLSSNPYGPGAMPQDRHLSEPSIPRQMGMNQGVPADARLPPPLLQQHSQPQQPILTNGHGLQRASSSQGYEAMAQSQSQNEHSPRLNSINGSPRIPDQMQSRQSIPSISNMVHASDEGALGLVAAAAASILPPVRHSSQSPRTRSIQEHPSPPQRATPPPPSSQTPPRASLSQAQQIAIAADAASRAGTASPGKRKRTSSIDEDMVSKVKIIEGQKTPEMAAAEAAKESAGNATPGEAGAPQDIPHAKLAGAASFGGEDMRAIRVLDRKFCI